MSQQTKHLSSKLNSFIQSYSSSESTVEKELRLITESLPLATMQTTPEQTHFLKFLIHSHQFKNILEIGTFTGYSALAMALSLPDDGHLTCCDINDTWTKYSIPHWKKANVEKKITLKKGDAKETLTQFINNNLENSFDFAFIDADKTQYHFYYESCLELVRPGGLIAVDNIFWYGKTVDETVDDKQTLAIRKLTQFISQDKRVKSCIVPIADGMMLASLI